MLECQSVELEDLDFQAGAVVIVVRDGKDTADSPAAKAFIKAVDRWLLAKVIVRITDTPSGEDANSVSPRTVRRSFGDWSLKPRRVSSASRGN